MKRNILVGQSGGPTAVINSRCLSGGTINTNTYAYLFKSQMRNTRQVKKATTIDMIHTYLKKVTTSAAAGTWRVISMDFDPWNDEYMITIHRISVN